MPRPQSCLCKGIHFEPNSIYFKPQGIRIKDLESVELSMEELESFRLRYVNNLEQIEASCKMGTSQSTYQRILHSSCKKIAEALVGSKAIRIVKHE